MVVRNSRCRASSSYIKRPFMASAPGPESAGSRAPPPSMTGGCHDEPVVREPGVQNKRVTELAWPMMRPSCFEKGTSCADATKGGVKGLAGRDNGAGKATTAQAKVWPRVSDRLYALLLSWPEGPSSTRAQHQRRQRPASDSARPPYPTTTCPTPPHTPPPLPIYTPGDSCQCCKPHRAGPQGTG